MAPRPPMPNDRSVLIFVGSLLLATSIAVIAITGTAAILVLDRLIRELPWLLLWLFAAAGYGRVLVDRLIALAPPLLRWASRIASGIGMISLLMLAIGLLGALSRPCCLTMMIVGAALFPWSELLALRSVKFSPPHKACYSWLAIAAVGGVVLVADCIPPGLLWTDEPHGYDVVEYHLQVPREWFEAGRIIPLEHNVFSYLPMNVEVQYLLAMELRGGPWAGMYLAQMMNTAFIICAVIALGSALGWRAALLAASVPWCALAASVCYVEAGLLMFAALGIIWALRLANFRSMIVAGGMIGFACGAKLTAIPMLLAPLAVAVFIKPSRFITPSPLGERAGERGGGQGAPSDGETLSPAISLKKGEGGVFSAIAGAMIFAGVAAVVLSPWLIRNFQSTGNPIFPEAQSVFRSGPFTHAQTERWDASLQPPVSQQSVGQRMLAFEKQTLLDMRWGYALFPLALISLALRRDRFQFILLAILLYQILFWLFFTHLQGRFLLPALPVAIFLAARVNWKPWHCLMIGGSIASSIIGIVFMVHRLSPLIPALDVDDLRGLLPQRASDAIDADRPISLIGDVNPFFYPVPMNKLFYRTVFDVKATPDQTAAEHWLDPENIGEAEQIVNDSELRRLCGTYRQMPIPPAKE